MDLSTRECLTADKNTEKARTPGSKMAKLTDTWAISDKTKKTAKASKPYPMGAGIKASLQMD